MSDRELHEVDREWLHRTWAKVRFHQRQATDAAHEWTRMNEALNEWCIKMGITDPKAVADQKSLNLELSGFLSTWDWHRREAERFMNDIQTFKAMRDMGVL